MYCPCKSNGPLMGYQQHIQKLTSLNRFKCPREAILMDLAKEINLWQEEGNHIVLLSDFNDDVTNTKVKTWAANLGLVEAITWLHPNDPPPTYQRGRRPIDGIFLAQKMLQKAAGGYFCFGEAVPSDHREIWLDLHLLEICLRDQLPQTPLRARWLQCKDPRIVNRYNTNLLQILQEHYLPEKIKSLSDKLQQPTDL